MSAIKFAYPIYLYLLFLIPLITGLFVIYLIVKKNRLKKYGELDIIKGLMPGISIGRPIVKFILFAIAFTFLILGIANLQVGSKLREAKREGVEIILALDVSKSMLADDIQPNRLEKAKMAISKLVDRLHNDKIGLIVFAGDAYVQLPITTDYASAKMFLSAISTEIVPIQGTAIGSAIELAVKSFSPDNDKNKALIIITDGENHEDDAVAAATKAYSEKIIIHTIGMGSPGGAPIIIQGRFGRNDYHTDKDGNVVVSKLDEKTLKQIASAGHGTYIRANNVKIGLDKIFDEIDKMDEEEYESQAYSDYEDRFQYFIAIALFFLLLEFILLERKNRWLKNINLFKNNISK